MHGNGGIGRLGQALDDLNLDAQSQIHGRNGGYDEDYEGGYDGFQEPLGYNVEHACK